MSFFIAFNSDFYQEERMQCYCLFCETAKCPVIVQEAKQVWPEGRALYPQQIQHIRKQGKMVDLSHALLPGYVFLYLDESLPEPFHLRRMNGVLRCLQYDDGTRALRGADEQFAMMLLEKDGVIGKTPVFQEGQQIRVLSGAYAGIQTRILKVNPRNMRMQIELPFAGLQVKTWVEYELVEKSGEDTEVTKI